MAYEFKKLSDVNVIEAMKDGLNVLVEDGGEIVKLAANSMIPEDVALKSDIPEGLPEGAATHQALVTDGEGTAKWEERTHYVDSDGTVHPLDAKFLHTTVPVIQSASVGQTVVVKAVDENGKPTEWEAVDMASGGGGVAFIDIKASANPLVWDTASGEYIALTKARFIELFNSGIIRTVESVEGPTVDPSVLRPGSTVRGTVVGYYINDVAAAVIVACTQSGNMQVGVNAWV